mmetsp:Transcript_43718/g.137779  ORF Transcript_43718/g.137779 Transcript_43718/m.137779 type:complete len:201 (+) Transcript_43718:415-1017(+)
MRQPSQLRSKAQSPSCTRQARTLASRQTCCARPSPPACLCTSTSPTRWRTCERQRLLAALRAPAGRSPSARAVPSPACPTCWRWSVQRGCGGRCTTSTSATSPPASAAAAPSTSSSRTTDSGRRCLSSVPAGSRRRWTQAAGCARSSSSSAAATRRLSRWSASALSGAGPSQRAARWRSGSSSRAARRSAWAPRLSSGTC